MRRTFFHNLLPWNWTLYCVFTTILSHQGQVIGNLGSKVGWTSKNLSKTSWNHWLISVKQFCCKGHAKMPKMCTIFWKCSSFTLRRMSLRRKYKARFTSLGNLAQWQFVCGIACGNYCMHTFYESGKIRKTKLLYRK